MIYWAQLYFSAPETMMHYHDAPDNKFNEFKGTNRKKGAIKYPVRTEPGKSNQNIAILNIPVHHDRSYWNESGG